jgi:hypothetical protein
VQRAAVLTDGSFNMDGQSIEEPALRRGYGLFLALIPPFPAAGHG